MSWFLYLIECDDGSVYTGITTDVDARFARHLNGTGARYTRSRKPRALLAAFPLADRSSASRAEYWVKRLTPAHKRELASGLRSLDSVLPATAVAAQRHADAADAAGSPETPAPATIPEAPTIDTLAAPPETTDATESAATDLAAAAGRSRRRARTTS